MACSKLQHNSVLGIWVYVRDGEKFGVGDSQ